MSRSASADDSPTAPPSAQPSRSNDSRSSLRSLADGLTGEASRLGATVGVAVAPLDGRGEVIGEIRSAVAWSTAKVPLAMAALDAHPGGATDTAVARAVRNSDNDAAQSLWDAWSDPVRAATAVRSVLRSAGDTRTEVPSRRRRDGFSVFGQTEWSLAAQAEFGARLACLPHGREVVAQMRRVAPGQQWGFADPGIAGGLREVAVKGGWGPDPDGSYLVRQLAIVTPEGGAPWAAALATRPGSGQFSDGAAALTGIADWLLDRLEVTGPAHCR